MLARTTEGVRIFIGALFVFFIIILFAFYHLVNDRNEVKRYIYKIPETGVKCAAGNRIGYLNTLHPRAGLKLIYDKKSSAICLKRVKDHLWSIHEG